MKKEVYLILTSKGIPVSDEDCDFLVERLNYLSALNSTLKGPELDELDISISVQSRGEVYIE